MNAEVGRVEAHEAATTTVFHPGRYCVVVLSTIAIACLIWLTVAMHQFGRHTIQSYGLCKLVEVKRAIAQGFETPKVLFVAGSSALRGLNAARVHMATGINIVNFGTHAGLPPGVLLYEAKSVLNPGDTAILAFEYTAYTRPGPTSRGIDFVFGCGREYFDQIPWNEKLMVLFGLSPLRIALPYFQAPEAYFEKWGRDETYFGSRGDLPSTAFKYPDPSRVASYGPTTVEINEEGIGAPAIAAFVEWAKVHDVEVYATWPNTIYFDVYEGHKGFQEIRDLYEELGVEMIGQPEDAMFPRELHYNTNYHLNFEGVQQRTDLFIETLRRTPSLFLPIARVDEWRSSRNQHGQRGVGRAVRRGGE